MRLSPTRAHLWQDAYASCLAAELRALHRAAADRNRAIPFTPAADHAVMAHCRASARRWLNLRAAGHPVPAQDDAAQQAAVALGLPDSRTSTIRNFLRGL